ncbi:MAG: glucoamylase family protein [Candidatus Binatia bacterium]
MTEHSQRHAPRLARGSIHPLPGRLLMAALLLCALTARAEDLAPPPVPPPIADVDPKNGVRPHFPEVAPDADSAPDTDIASEGDAVADASSRNGVESHSSEPVAKPASADAASPDGDLLAENVQAVPPTTTLPPPAPDAHEKIDTIAPTLLTTVGAPKKAQWEADNGGFTASRLAIARRLVNLPDRLVTKRSSLPRDRENFLWRVARDTWNGLQAYTDRENGLIIDNVRVVGGLVPPLALKIGDYTNITNIGLQLTAIVAARRIGLIVDPDARAQIVRILDTLATLDTHEGYFFNYYDTTTLEPTSSFLSFVDTAWLVAGLIVTRQGFPDLAYMVNRILEPINLGYFYDEETGLMSHGYYVNLDSLSGYQYGHFFTEARLGSVIAIGKGDAPASHWYSMRRATKSPCVDGECPELHRLRYENAEGDEMSVWHFRWRNYKYVPSWGGSMFEALMPRLVLDEGRWSPRSLGPNGYAHASLQKLYATDVLGLPVWGMSPCISPDSGRYREFGVKPLGSHGYSEDVVTPHAAALALAVTPDDAVEALMEMAQRYDMYGPFGFYDAVDPATGKVAWDHLALDQLMLFLSVANHLSRGYVPDLFASDPWVKDALPLLAEERFFQ